MRTLATLRARYSLANSGEHFLAALLLLWCASAVVSQEPAASKPTPTQPKADKLVTSPVAPLGTIKGRVTADDGRVLSNTMVMARAINGTGGMKTGPVDTEGRFTFNDLSAGVYIVLATSPGYVDETINAGDLAQVPRHLIGSELKIRLAKGGVITGSVVNSKGEPVVGVSVRAAPTKGLGLFLQSPGNGASAETDDRGIYRLFGLAPGQYLVESGGSGSMGRFSAPTGYELDVPTFYPSSSHDTAVPVSVRAGEEATGIDIRYKGTEGHSLSGTVGGVADASAMPARSVLLTYAGTSTHLGSAVVGTQAGDSSFTFDAVADGEYDLTAFQLSNPTENVSAATRRVVVNGADVTGVELVMAPLANLSGSIKLEPIDADRKCDKRGSELMEVQFEFPFDDAKKSSNKLIGAIFSSFGASLAPNGDFSVRHLQAGTYRPKFNLPTEAWYVRSIVLPSRATSAPAAGSDGTVPAGPATEPVTVSHPIWLGTVVVRSGARISGVSVAIGQDAAGLSGRVVTTPEKSPIPPNLLVHLVPADKTEARNVLRYFETAVERSGNFAITNIPPGRYFLMPGISSPHPPEEKPRPLAFDATTRLALHRDAEALNNIIELKPCQRAIDVALPFKPGPQ